MVTFMARQHVNNPESSMFKFVTVKSILI